MQPRITSTSIRHGPGFRDRLIAMMEKPSTKRKRPAGIAKSHGEAEAERLAVAALTALGMPGDLESLAKIRKGQQEKSSYRGPVEGTNGGWKSLDCTTVGNGASWIREPSGSSLRQEPKPKQRTGKTEEIVEMRYLTPFRKATIFIAGLLLMPVSALPAADPPKPTKPNIIFILFDDLGHGEPPCNRADSNFKTPNLDKLAHDGMRFTDAHSASSVCTPTRYGVITGRYPWRIGQYGVLSTFSPPIIERQRITVASLLRQNGYHTACFGKWHLGMDWPKGTSKPDAGLTVTGGPVTRGFDVFFGYTEARDIGTVLDQNRVAKIYQPVEVQPMVAKRAVAYLEQRAQTGTPFFLYLPLSIPHTPIVPAAEFAGKSGAGNYGDWILQGDAVVDQIRAALDRLKLAENTLVLVSSDNGAEHREYPPLRGSKRSIYEGGHRVPFLAYWSGKIKPGSVCNDTICLNDLLATCADIIGAKLPDNAGEDSVSILPDLFGTTTNPVREATVHQSMKGDLAIRQGPWKLVFLVTGQKELYNLKNDRGETKNLAATQPEVVVRLTRLMQHYIATGRSTPGAPQKNAVPVSLTGKKVRNHASAEPE